MSLKKLVCIGLCTAMIGLGSMPVFAAQSSVSAMTTETVVQGQDNGSIITDNGKYLRISTQYFDSSSSYKQGVVPNMTIKMLYPQKLSFKLSLNVKQPYGRVVSKKAVIYENGVAHSLKSDKNGVYTYDTSKPLLYKLYVSVKTDTNTTVRTVYTIDNRKFAKSSFVSKDGTYTNHYNCVDVPTAIKNMNGNYNAFICKTFMFPAGSHFDFMVSDSFTTSFSKAYIAKYSDYAQNGMSAKWTEITADTALKAGEYAVKFVLKNTSNNVKEVIGIPYVCVGTPVSTIDMKTAMSVYKQHDLLPEWEGADDVTYSYNYSDYTNMNKLYTGEADFYINTVDGKDKVYKTVADYKNFISIAALVTAYDYCDISDVMFGNEFAYNTMANISGFISLPIEDMKIYYAEGEDIDIATAKFKLLTTSLSDIQRGIRNKYTNKMDASKTDKSREYYYQKEQLAQYGCYNLKVKYKVAGVWKICVIKNLVVSADN